ncbi:MAG: glycosyltransferase family 4 protein [Capsulimonadaceae bacterium]
MQILFVAPYVPSPARFRSLRIIQGLAVLGHRVTVVALSNRGTNDEDARQALAEMCEAVHLVPLSRGSSLLQSALHVATSTPLWAASHFSPGLDSILTKLTSETTYDIGHVEHLRMAYVATRLKKRMPLVFDAIECVTDQHLTRIEDSDTRAFDRLVSQKDLEKLRHYEPQLAAQFDRVLISSEKSASRMMELAEADDLSISIDVLPNGVDLDYFHPQESTPILPGNIVFPGQMNNYADRDAVSYFCQEIFPGIRNAYPLATVTFVGGDPTPALQALAADPNSGIEATGRVWDARPYLARAAVAVCPLRVSGSRSRNRVLQIMAMGKALVAAAPACLALGAAAAGECLCMADTPLSFATQIIHLFNHPEEAARLGANARTYVEDNHDWSRIVRRLTQVYDEVVAARSCIAA